MENKEEKFFEDLSISNLTEDSIPQDMSVELAKSGGATASRSRVSIHKHKTSSLDNEPEGQLTIDVYQTSDEIVVESAVAGVDPEDLDIDVTTDSITIRGKRHREKEINEEDYFYRECYWGRFSRSVILPQEVDPNGTNASFKNGILTVRMPKVSRQKSKKVRVTMS